MYDETNLMNYKASMHIIRRWLNAGLITESDFARSEAVISERFGIPKNSIWRDQLMQFDEGNRRTAINEEKNRIAESFMNNAIIEEK